MSEGTKSEKDERPGREARMQGGREAKK